MRRTLVHHSIFLLFIALVPALSVSGQTLLPKGSTSPLYAIEPNDILQIFVWHEEKLSGKVLVRPDGRISFPLVQDIQAAGLNPGQLKEKIEQSLKDYIKDAPNVTVIVEAIQNYRVYVMGKVMKPGPIMNEQPISVLQALAMAGGTSEFANLAEIVIVRGTGEDSTSFRFNYTDAIKGTNYSQNMLLKPGDVVVVP